VFTEITAGFEQVNFKLTMQGRNCYEGKFVFKEALDWAAHIIIAVLIGLFIVNFVAQITIVNGSSMETTLHNGDRLIIEKISPRFGWLKRGDIVTINDYPGLDSDRKPIIKRIIGLEGDKVEIRDGKVYVNGEALEEDYINVDVEELWK